MHRPPSLHRRHFLAALVALISFWLSGTTAALADDSAADFGTSVGTVFIPEGLDARDAIASAHSAFANHRWTVVEKTDSRIVGSLIDDGWSQTLTAVIDGNQIKLYCKGTRRGSAGINDRWVRYYTKRLNTYLSRRLGL